MKKSFNYVMDQIPNRTMYLGVEAAENIFPVTDQIVWKDCSDDVVATNGTLIQMIIHLKEYQRHKSDHDESLLVHKQYKRKR
jgi:hypothetical protein